MKNNDSIFDVAIVGSGMVGSSLALALSNLPLKVALIDPYPQNSGSVPAFDARAIALSWAINKNIPRTWDLVTIKANRRPRL